MFRFSPAFDLRWNPEPEPFLRGLNESLNQALISVNSFLSQGKKKPIVSYNKSAHYLYYSDYRSRHYNWLLRGFRRNCVFKGLCLELNLAFVAKLGAWVLGEVGDEGGRPHSSGTCGYYSSRVRNIHRNCTLSTVHNGVFLDRPQLVKQRRLLTGLCTLQSPSQDDQDSAGARAGYGIQGKRWDKESKDLPVLQCLLLNDLGQRHFLLSKG